MGSIAFQTHLTLWPGTPAEKMIRWVITKERSMMNKFLKASMRIVPRKTKASFTRGSTACNHDRRCT